MQLTIHSRFSAILLPLLLLAICACSEQVVAQTSTFGEQPGSSPGQGHQAPNLPTYQAPQYGPIGQQVPVAEIRITGNSTTTNQQILAMLNTREGRVYDPEVVQADVRALLNSRMFSNVRTYREEKSTGMVVTFEVFERSAIRYLRYVGNNGIRDSLLTQQTGLEVGQALDTYAVEEARRKLEAFYRSYGFGNIQVSIREGATPTDRGVVFIINEGVRQRIFHTRFEGNTIASDARLRTQIQSKRGILWYIKGAVVYETIEADVERLTAYYRALGYFRARISRELEWDDNHAWLTITFVVDEGPRYQIRSVSFAGNRYFDDTALRGPLELKPGDHFDLTKMNRDLRELTDLYGSRGHVFADIQADPRFLEEPGQLDLVYDIQEGDQYRVGEIHIHIDGDYATTRQNVVLNRLSLRPGDIIDTRQLNASRTRLISSQFFVNEPAQGIRPSIVVRPPELQEQQFAEGPPSSVRGQSPSWDRTSRYQQTQTDTSSAAPRCLDLHIYGEPAPASLPATPFNQATPQ